MRNLFGRAARTWRGYGSVLSIAAMLGVVVFGAAGRVVAQDGGSGVQVSPDAKRVLVSKDVGNERWSITQNDDGTVTGNVFALDGGQPSFIWCDPEDGGSFGDFWDDFIDDLIGGDDDDDGDDDELRYACYGASACGGSPCDEDEWDFIADVTLPESFFRP
jgi:hypothetical protein